MATQKLYAGAKLRETRMRLGLTQKVFADRLGVSLPYLNQMENNHRPVSSAVILSLVQEFGFDVSELGSGDGERLVSDLRDNYERSVVSATYIGLHQIAGVRHHHLLLSNESIDYQIWIDDGPDPLPRKIVITHHEETGVPQETVHITGWNFQPQVQDVVFEFNPPADADEVDIERVSGDSK